MNTALKLELLRQMLRIRTVEETIAEHYPQGKMRCPTHLSIGQEAVPSAASVCLKSTDFAVSTHRGHAHYLAKGGDLKAMIAEIYGKVTGCSRGKGGSMHLIDRRIGFMGTSAIVGNSIPIGVGLALSAQLQGTDQISCIFIGDGAVEEGVFYESVNFAVLRNLPVLFVCENNLYSVYSPLAVRQPPGRQIAAMVAGLGAKVAAGDGNRVVECYKSIQVAAEALRSGQGPWFLEFSTYRWREHCGYEFDNHLGYRSAEEFEAWQKRDPIAMFEADLLEEDPKLTQEITVMKTAIQQEVVAAFTFAEDSPFPQPEEAYVGTYSN
jgi:TPP-dependent pyruvate/acetoin dehydrogenase alpha subunit